MFISRDRTKFNLVFLIHARTELPRIRERAREQRRKQLAKREIGARTVYSYEIIYNAYSCAEWGVDTHARTQIHTAQSQRKSGSTKNRIFLSGWEKTAPSAILFENIPRDQSRDERRFCCSNGFVNKIGKGMQDAEAGKGRGEGRQTRQTENILVYTLVYFRMR